MAPTELLAEQHLATVAPLAGAARRASRAPDGRGQGRGAARRRSRASRAGEIALAVGTHALIQEGVRVRPPRPRRRRRAAPLRRAAAGGAAAPRRRARRGRRPGHERDADPAHARADALRRPRRLDARRAAAGPDADRAPTLCRESRRERMVRAHPRRRWRRATRPTSSTRWSRSRRRATLRAATTMVRELAAGPLAGLRLDLVHGRMKPEEKDAVMRRFKAGEFDVLVSTTVIEVGIDVPNATVIVDRARRALRPGAAAPAARAASAAARRPGYCFLVVPDWMARGGLPAPAGARADDRRLRASPRPTSQLRGPGDFLGTRQAGLPPFRVANLLRDTALLRAARDEATAWLERDPDLSRPSRPACARSCGTAGGGGSSWRGWANWRGRRGCRPRGPCAAGPRPPRSPRTGSRS